MSADPLKDSTAVLMKGIVKHFPDVVANSGIDFRILKGEIHTLLGENGAGKTTLMNILSGYYQPDAGQIIMDDEKPKQKFNTADPMRPIPRTNLAPSLSPTIPFKNCPTE